jgi:hypothetical protein
VSDSGNRSVSAGGNITGSIIQTGNNNVATLTVTQLPPADEVDINAVVAALRTLLAGRGGEDSRKVANALDDADAELAKAEPDKAEVAGTLTRALGYVKKAGELSEHIEKISPLVTKIAGWIGSAADYGKLLAVLGLSAA